MEKMDVGKEMASIVPEWNSLRKWTQEEKDAYFAVREQEDQKRAQQFGRTYRLHATGLRGKQLQNRFDRFVSASEEQVVALVVARRFAQKWPDVKKGLAFWGSYDEGVGVGKDMLLHAIALEIVERTTRYNIRYCYSLGIQHRMLREYDTFGGDPEDTNEEEEMSECDLLMIGDLYKLMALDERSVKNGWIKNAVLRVIDQASSTGKPIMCITSNFALEKYGKERDKALESRLAGLCEWHEVKGKDMRRAKC